MDHASPDTTSIYRFSDRITVENTDRLVAEIDAVFAAPDAQRIVFDLENIHECSSYGLRLLLIFQRRAQELNKTLVLYRPSAVLMDLLKTTRLDKVFFISDVPDR
jgi:anti-anti-sigma factor